MLQHPDVTVEDTAINDEVLYEVEARDDCGTCHESIYDDMYVSSPFARYAAPGASWWWYYFGVPWWNNDAYYDAVPIADQEESLDTPRDFRRRGRRDYGAGASAVRTPEAAPSGQSAVAKPAGGSSGQQPSQPQVERDSRRKSGHREQSTNTTPSQPKRTRKKKDN